MVLLLLLPTLTIDIPLIQTPTCLKIGVVNLRYSLRTVHKVILSGVYFAVIISLLTREKIHTQFTIPELWGNTQHKKSCTSYVNYVPGYHS